jgi:predicted HicB family RNase H-like nuclease
MADEVDRRMLELKAESLQVEEVEAVRALLQRLQTPAARTGEKVPLSFRLEKSLVAAFKAHAESQGISLTEAVSRAIERDLSA